MDTYSRHVAWSNEDQRYIATSAEFPTLSGVGDTYIEALEELNVALEATIEVYQEEGWELPAPRSIAEYSGQFRLRLPKSLHASLVKRAEMESVSLNTLVVQYLSEKIGAVNAVSWIEQRLKGSFQQSVSYTQHDLALLWLTSRKSQTTSLESIIPKIDKVSVGHLKSEAETFYIGRIPGKKRSVAGEKSVSYHSV